ncbi:hypothetical protein, partial [Streptomyces chiangmaiensis]
MYTAAGDATASFRTKGGTGPRANARRSSEVDPPAKNGPNRSRAQHGDLHYLDTLIGPKLRADLYRARAPIRHADRIEIPLFT